MTYEIWQSVDFGDSCMGYRPGIEMVKRWTGDIEFDERDLGWNDDVPSYTLERIFYEFQRVDENHMPPDSYIGRSLNFGDVVKLGDRWFACGITTWELTLPIETHEPVRP